MIKSNLTTVLWELIEKKQIKDLKGIGSRHYASTSQDKILFWDSYLSVDSWDKVSQDAFSNNRP